MLIAAGIGGAAGSDGALANQPGEKPAVAEKSAAAGTDTQALKGTRARTRFVIGLERDVDFQVFSLQNPNRVVVDLPEIKLQLPTLSGEHPVGLVKSFRVGATAAGKAKLIIDVTDAVVVESAKLEPGREGRSPRLVLEIVPADGAKPVPKKPFATAVMANVGLSGVQPPLPKPAERPEARAARAFKPVIVLDPGHGGMDSGAARNGAVEKEVVLLFGQMLRDKLNATGRYKVLMTRDSDTFVDLNERRAFAERHNAALFIAIHADYAGANARGATIYSLRESVANDLKRSAASKGEVARSVAAESHGKTKPQSDSDSSVVNDMLADLAQNEVQVNKVRTNLFSRSVIEYMGSSTTMMSNPDRTAAFRVLVTAKVPSVLIELAYVSNKEDAAHLKSTEWRTKVAASIVTAVENYFSNQIARFPM